MPKFEVKKQAIDALLENLGVGKEPPDKNYNKPFGEKGTELESLHTDGVTIPTSDFHVASGEENKPDTGKYDEEAEGHTRLEARDWSQYDEAPETDDINGYDPEARYNCGRCDMRENSDQCMRVEGPVNFEIGGCRLFHLGEPEDKPPMKTKFTKEEVKYGENEGGFSCARCKYGDVAKSPDKEGRNYFCDFWGMHVIPTACCSEWEKGSSDKMVTSSTKSYGMGTPIGGTPNQPAPEEVEEENELVKTSSKIEDRILECYPAETDFTDYLGAKGGWILRDGTIINGIHGEIAGEALQAGVIGEDGFRVLPHDEVSLINLIKRFGKISGAVRARLNAKEMSVEFWKPPTLPQTRTIANSLHSHGLTKLYWDFNYNETWGTGSMGEFMRAVESSKSKTSSTNISSSCWLTPDGKFIPCNGKEHDDIALQLGFKGNGEELSSAEEVLKSGYVRVAFYNPVEVGIEFQNKADALKRTGDIVRNISPIVKKVSIEWWEPSPWYDNDLTLAEAEEKYQSKGLTYSITENETAKVSYDYTAMFNRLVKEVPELEPKVKEEISWAKLYLRRQDRIMWYLRWLRLFWDRQKSPELLKRDLSEYKVQIIDSDIPKDMPGLKRILQHLMSIQDKKMQAKIWGFETPDELKDDLYKIEEELKERMENERRIVKQSPYDVVWIDFGNGWFWEWLDRAYSPEEAAAMGHCGNSPRSDTSDTILSLRQTIEKGGKKYVTPHLTFILDEDNILGEMKGRGNDKPSAKYHPYIIALLKDSRIKGIKGGGYLPSHNFKLSDLTKNQIEEIEKVNPNIIDPIKYYRSKGRTLEVAARLATAMGLSPNSYSEEHGLFVVQKWDDVRDMVGRIGDYEADKAIEYALSTVTDENYQGEYDYEIPRDKNIPTIHKIAKELSKDLTPDVKNTIGKELEEEDPYIIDAFKLQRKIEKIDYEDRDTFYSLIYYIGHRGRTTKTWETIIESFKKRWEVKYRDARIADLEYAIDNDVYEQRENGVAETELRFGLDFSPQWTWTSSPAYEVITWDNAVEWVEDEDNDHDISAGILSFTLGDYYDNSDDEDGNEAADILNKWYSQGRRTKDDSEQLPLSFTSSLLKKADVEFKETPKFLPQRDDMRGHLDEDAKDDAMEGVLPPPPSAAPVRRRKQIDPNIQIKAGIKLLAYIDGSTPKTWNLSSKRAGLDIVNKNWGPLTSKEETTLLKKGSLKIENKEFKLG